MRNLKFRTWVEDSNRFYFFDSIFNAPDPCYTGEIQQFTGLKDSRGVEIYEGDIVRSDWNGLESEVRFGLYNEPDDDGENFQNGFYFLDREVRYKLDEGTALSLDISGETSKYTVVGNIYENAELLAATTSTGGESTARTQR